MDQISFRLKPVAPFDLRLTAWALRHRPNNIIDRWDDQSYRRVIVYDGKPVEVEVTQTGTSAKPILHATATTKKDRTWTKIRSYPCPGEDAGSPD